MIVGMNALVQRLRPLLNRERLVDTAVRLIAVPSPTGDAGAVSDALADHLTRDGFPVERPDGGYPKAPAVAVRLDSGKAGRVLQFDGHLDTVHLPFAPPDVDGGRITGSGAADMKGGIAAAVESLRILKDASALSGGSVLFTAHDLHESPWGDGRQLEGLIRAGFVGDAALLPEPMFETLPVAGRGLAIWKVEIRRQGGPVHEVMRPREEPSVISAAGALIRELDRLSSVLSARDDGFAGPPELHPGKPSVFIGQVHSGEIYNQYPQVCRLEGTRRWLPGTDRVEVEREFRGILDHVTRGSGATVSLDWIFTRDAFRLDPAHEFVATFRSAYEACSGRPIGLGAKPFVDDGNTFWATSKIPAITHGARSAGQHTVHEWVDVDDLCRVALLYAATACSYCANSDI